MKYLYSFILLFFIFFFINQKEPYRFSEGKNPLLELSSQGIQNYTEHSIQEIQNFFNHPLFSLSSSHQILEKLNETGLHLASRLAVLKYIDTLTDNPTLIRQGKYGFWKIIRVSLLKNWKHKINTILGQLDQNLSLKPHQQFIFKKFIKRASLSSLSKKQTENIENILNSMDQELTPYTYLRGNKEEKQSKSSFSLLSFNVCFTPNDMPLVFGGLDKWENRIDKVVTLIDESNADVVCLQEIFDTKAHTSLYEKLKDRYSHFYTNIGPWSFEGSFSTLGFESGLFVASKYPIIDPTFIPFEKDNPHIHRGFFIFDVQSKDGTPLGKIFTTHLEPFSEGKTLRKQEFEQILEQIHVRQNDFIPTILCGDLNMPPEESKPWIDRYFIDNFSGEVTHCDFTLQRWNHPKKGELKPNQLDYTLLLKTNAHQIQTALIKAFDLDDLENATSDHHAMYTEVDRHK